MIEPHRAEIQEHQFGALQRNTPFIVLGSMLLAVVVWWVLNGAVSAVVLGAWLALLLLHSVLRLGFWAWMQRRPAGPGGVDVRLRLHAALSLASGLLWGGGAFWLIGSPEVEHRLLVTFMLAGMVSSSLHSQTAYLPAFYGFFVPCAVGGVGANLLLGGRFHLAVAISVLAYSLLAHRFARTLNANFLAGWRAHYQLADLAERLRLQKEAAEQANLAKSRFLAAASHDLRQPVHALAMFIGTLQMQTLDAYVAELVQHAAEAVRSMDAMFTALLDISRLDAGVVQAEPRAVNLAALLDRLCAEMLPLAQAKGLALHCHAPALVVWSDALLLERILRNLLSNAVRYTERGRVVIGCRRRADRIEIQVWDSGCGIPAERQAEVFREFVQLQPGPQRQGIGLGLAIVQRLAQLLQHPLRLQSWPGRGSMFGITVPLLTWTAAPPDLALSGGSFPPGRASSRLVLVLDDDAGICTAMRLLLGNWGLRVIAATDCVALLAQATQQPEGPALIICDYGLGAGPNGLEVIELLRDEFNDETPAILITGNTAPERLQEALAAGHRLLHKPVQPEQLRQAIDEILTPAMPPAAPPARPACG
ncbi:MAG: hypothetical protein RLY71_3042 [Pseudomonadota bacterium]|jgi:signal transduction histidine kinase/CheY-like chemotaxis protein